MKDKEKQNRFTPLSNFRREGKKLLHPLSQKIQLVQWERDLIPEFLWIDALA